VLERNEIVTGEDLDERPSELTAGAGD